MFAILDSYLDNPNTPIYIIIFNYLGHLRQHLLRFIMYLTAINYGHHRQIKKSTLQQETIQGGVNQ